MSSCYRPIHGFLASNSVSGCRRLLFKGPNDKGPCSSRSLAIPCRGCIGCRLEYARQWAMRCMDEASLWSENSFITLTIKPEMMAKHGRSLCHRNFQLFMKRLRKFTGGQLIRYFMCGEYGAKFGRPHYHALLFNMGFPDRVYLKTTASGEKIYRSASLEANWDFGYSSVADVTFGSAAYVARYHVKKVGGVVERDHYLDKRTGELLAPEYVKMSRGDHVRGTGGIARGWIEKYMGDVYPGDRRVISGVDTKPSRFYDLYYGSKNPAGFEVLKAKRLSAAEKLAADNTSARLAVKEKVKYAQIAALTNSLEEIYQ